MNDEFCGAKLLKSSEFSKSFHIYLFTSQINRNFAQKYLINY